MSEKIKKTSSFSKPFYEWLMKQPAFQKNFSAANESLLKTALYYDKKVDDATIRAALKIDELTKQRDCLDKEIKELIGFEAYKREQKQKEMVINESNTNTRI